MTQQVDSTRIDELDWTTLHAVYLIGQFQTLTQAAKQMGVHRTTLMRHVNSLERHIGRNIFERSADGYTPTRFGAELIEIAKRAHDQFQMLAQDRRDTDSTLEDVITIAAPNELAFLMAAAISGIAGKFPDLWYSFVSLPPEAGDLPDIVDIVLSRSKYPAADFIAQNTIDLKQSLFASMAYVEQHGLIHSLDDFPKHKFVARLTKHEGEPGETWLMDRISPQNVVFRSNAKQALNFAIEHGIGIGFMPVLVAASNDNLIQVTDASEAWSTPVWISARSSSRRRANSERLLSEMVSFIETNNIPRHRTGAASDHAEIISIS